MSARLRIATATVDVTIEVTEGDDTVALLAARIDSDFRERGGIWVEVGRLQGIAESGTVDTEADLVWCAASATTVTVTFEGDVPDAAADLGILPPRD